MWRKKDPKQSEPFANGLGSDCFTFVDLEWLAILKCGKMETRKYFGGALMICNKNHRYLSEYTSFPQSQDNQSGDRHICAGCAYEEGLKDGLAGLPQKRDLSHLPESQAGTVRHKGAIEAYDVGYAEGKRRSS